jgi:transcriptional regulator with XRE-family HTH domain
MSTEFALDLRLARRKAGFTQRDCAHLLAIPTAILAQLESGKRLPSLVQVCTLSVIYGRSFESLFGAILNEARAALRSRILNMPDQVRAFAGTRNRDHSIERLAQRLAEEQEDNGGA